MKSLILTASAGIALLSLTACDKGANDDATPAAATTIAESAAPMPAATASDATSGNSVSIDKNGVTVNTDNGDTSVQVKTNGNPSASAKTN